MTGGVPHFVRRLALQSPEEGPFDVNNLTFEPVIDQSENYNVAKIALSRLDDFVEGEQARGLVRLLKRDKSNGKKSVVIDLVVYCYRGKLQPGKKKSKGQDGTVAGPGGDSQELSGGQPVAGEQPFAAGARGAPSQTAPQVRRSRCEHGQSVKCNCLYGFTVKAYVGFEDSCVIKFKEGREQHVDGDGVAVHEGSCSNAPLSDTCRQFVYERLLLHAKPANILLGASRVATSAELVTRPLAA